MTKLFALLCALLIYCAPLYAQELHVLGGMLSDTANHDQSYTWSLEYLQKIKEHLAFSVSWLNEGHLPNNHRDGIAVQLWGQTKRLDNRFVLAAGVGPYVYYDTELVRNGRGFSDTHGVGGIFSLAGLWYTESPWIIQLRTNMVKTNNIDTYSAMRRLWEKPIRGGQFRSIPSAAQRFDEQDGGIELLAADGHHRPLVCEGDSLCGYDTEITDDSGLILIGGQDDRFPGRIHRFVLNPRLLFEDTQCRKVILHLLETRENGLAIGGYSGFIGGNGLFRLSVTGTAVEERLGQRCGT